MKKIIYYTCCFCVFALFLSRKLSSQNEITSYAEGQLTVAGNNVIMHHAYAVSQPGFFDKKTEDIVVIVTNIPLSDNAIEDRWERNAMVADGLLNSVEITINSKQQPISVSIKHPLFKANPSGFSSNYILDLKTLNEDKIEGRIYCKTEQEFFETVYTFDFTFSAEVRRKKELPPPTVAEKEEATNSPQAAVYLAFVKAVNARDVKILKKVLASEIANELDGPNGEELLEFMQIDAPPNAEFQRIVEKGDIATLILRAKDERETLKGVIEFIKEGSLWKIMLSSWENE